jgi:hypothetical protein
MAAPQPPGSLNHRMHMCAYKLQALRTSEHARGTASELVFSSTVKRREFSWNGVRTAAVQPALSSAISRCHLCDCAQEFPQRSLLRASFAHLQSRRWECRGNVKLTIDQQQKRTPGNLRTRGCYAVRCLNLGSSNRAAGCRGWGAARSGL